MWKWLKRVFPSEHEWAAQQLSAYLDSELSPSDRERVEAHLKECQTCTEELRTLRWTVSLAAQMPTLKAPRSFLITEAIAQPRRMPFSVAYVYLRSATVAVAALLSIVLASDFLLPYLLSARVPPPRMAVRRAVPAVEELRVKVEAVQEEQVEREAAKQPPTMAPLPLEAGEVERPVPEAQAFEQEAERKIVLEVEPSVEEAMKPKGMPPRAAPTERAPEGDLGAATGGGKVEQPTAAEETTEALPVAPSTPTSVSVVRPSRAPTPTPSSRYQTAQAHEAAPLPQPTLSPTVVAEAQVTEPAVRPSPAPRRSALHLMEVGLALLMIPLVISTVIVRIWRR